MKPKVKKVLDVLAGAVSSFNPRDVDNGFVILIRHGQVGVVGQNTYVVGPDHLKLLREAEIPYKIIKRS
ncbi:MAG: hypothetical protein V1712_03105 [Patescibacteria group bacterium]